MNTRTAFCFAFAVVAASTIASWWIWRGTAFVPSPPLDVSPPELDLGAIFVGDSVQFKIRLRNTSPQKLAFGLVRPSCSCGNVRIDRRQLEPEEEASLTGTFRGAGSAGPFRQSILVVLATPGEEQFLIPVRGMAKSRIAVSPQTVRLRPDFAAGKPGSGTFLVENRSAQAIRLERPPRLPAGITLTLEKTALAQGESASISLVAGANEVIPRSDTIRLGCSHPAEKGIYLPVELAPVEEVSVNPSEIPLGVVPKRDLLARKTISVLFEGKLLAGCEVLGLKTPRYLSCAAGPETSPTRRLYLFIIEDKFEGSDLGGKIALALRHKVAGRDVTVEAPVSGFLMDSVTH